MQKRTRGFTLIEILVVIGIIAILAAIVIVAINPAKRFQDARNSQRMANVEAIMSAIQQNMIDNKGIFSCGGTPIPVATTTIENGGNADIASCLGQYLAILPIDPSDTAAYWTSAGDYNTGYQISQYPSGQIDVSAPQSEADPVGQGLIHVVR